MEARCETKGKFAAPYEYLERPNLRSFRALKAAVLAIQGNIAPVLNGTFSLFVNEPATNTGLDFGP